MTINAVRLNHAVLYVSDLNRSVSFYESAFGMTVAAREPRANAHLAWQVDTIEELEESRLTLANLDAYTGEYENAAPVDRLDLAAEVSRWTGVSTAAELVPLGPR